jgi:hypothetical protein
VDAAHKQRLASPPDGLLATGFITRVRGRWNLRSWTSALRSSRKFGAQEKGRGLLTPRPSFSHQPGRYGAVAQLATAVKLQLALVGSSSTVLTCTDVSERYMALITTSDSAVG